MKITGIRGQGFEKKEYNVLQQVVMKHANKDKALKKKAKEETEDKREHLKWYSRKKWNRKDKIIKVKYEHIKHLKIKYYGKYPWNIKYITH